MHGLNLDSSSPENNIYSPIKESVTERYLLVLKQQKAT